MKFRYIFEELGFHDLIATPTLVYCDNDTAIQWVQTGKVTDGNMYIDLAFGLSLFFAKSLPKFRFAFRTAAAQIAPQISQL